MRNRFDQQLAQLNVELVTMGALCEEALTYAIRSLFQKEEGMIERTLEAEDQINQKEKEIVI
jgi:phosphate transport system protein